MRWIIENGTIIDVFVKWSRNLTITFIKSLTRDLLSVLRCDWWPHYASDERLNESDLWHGMKPYVKRLVMETRLGCSVPTLRV